MPLPDQTPKLPKLPFLVGDALLIAAAWLIVDRAPQPLDSLAILAFVGCVALGGLLAVVPFLTDYVRQQDEALDDRQRGLEALARTVSTAADQASITTKGLQELIELAQRNIRQAEHLPNKLQERIADFRSQISVGRDEAVEKLEQELTLLRSADTERLEATADKLGRAVSSLAKAIAAAEKRIGADGPAVARAEERLGDHALHPQTEAATKTIIPEERVEANPPHPQSAKTEAPAPEAAAAPAPEPVAAPVPEPIAKPEISLEAPKDETVAAAPEPPPAKPPRKPRAPKPKAETPPSITDAPETKPESPPSKEEDEPMMLGLALPESAESDGAENGATDAIASDGATRLLATAYIGIGNRLFIRGEGPGLSWEKGVPLQFVSIGKWRWETSAAAAPVKYRLFKNDDLECQRLGQREVEPGHQQEVTAQF